MRRRRGDRQIARRNQPTAAAELGEEAHPTPPDGRIEIDDLDPHRESVDRGASRGGAFRTAGKLNANERRPVINRWPVLRRTRAGSLLEQFLELLPRQPCLTDDRSQ